MITSIHYKNFKALHDCTLPLGRFTLIVGPNGSGKSTAMQALKVAGEPMKTFWDEIVSVDNSNEPINISITNESDATLYVIWREGKDSKGFFEFAENGKHKERVVKTLEFYHEPMLEQLKSFRLFNFEAKQIAKPVSILKSIELEQDGLNLTGVLDDLRDRNYKRFEELNKELHSWLPEFERISFDKPSDGVKSLMLDTTIGSHQIKAEDISHGTLLALAYLTVAYLPNPPKIVCFEEPERGIHPRLLRDIRDAMYRLAYPEQFGENREPVQVIATTHSPYLLDLYKDHPEEIVIANKDENGVHFERLSDKPRYEEFLQDIPLGEVWYSGVLGGIPAQR